MIGRRLLSLVAVSMVLWSCNVPTDPVVPEQLASDSLQQLEQRYTKIDPNRQGTLTLSEAMALSIVNNFNHRMAMMRTAFAVEQSKLAVYDFLPQLTVDAGYRWRTPGLQTLVRSGITNNNDGAITSGTYQQNTGSDEFHARVGLNVSVIDFVMAYFRRGELLNKALSALEERRRVVQNIVQQVRSTYWRAVAAERMLSNITPVMVQLNDAVRQSELAEVQRLVPPLEALEYQRSLYTIMQEIDSIRRELVNVKAELAVLINARPGENIRVLIPHDVDVIGLAAQIPEVQKLEIDALQRRPELRQQVYNERVTVAEGYRALASLMPGLNIVLGGNYSSNAYLRDNAWFDISPLATINLVNSLVKSFSQNKINKSRAAIEREAAVALAAAVVAQVNLANGAFQQSVREFEGAERLYKVNSRILRQVMAESNAKTSTGLQRIKAEANHLLAQLLLDVSFAQVQDAYGRLLVVIGDDPLPGGVLDSTNIAELVPLLENYNRSFGVRYDVPINLIYYNI